MNWIELNSKVLPPRPRMGYCYPILFPWSHCGSDYSGFT